MTSTADHDYKSRCERAATHFLWQAILPIIIVAILQFAVSTDTTPTLMLSLLAVLAGYATVALSILLIFDALLFRLMATYPDDMSGGAAVDDLLARMRLKPRTTLTRPLDDRLRGTSRILKFQRIALGIFVAARLAATLQIG